MVWAPTISSPSSPISFYPVFRHQDRWKARHWTVLTTRESVMPELTLQFVAMIEGPSSAPAVAASLKAAFPESKTVNVKVHSFDLRENWIEIWPNRDADPGKVSDDDGYMFYGYELQATPTMSVNEDHQIQLARDLVVVLEGEGWKVVVCANFEDRL